MIDLRVAQLMGWLNVVCHILTAVIKIRDHTNDDVINWAMKTLVYGKISVLLVISALWMHIMYHVFLHLPLLSSTEGLSSVIMYPTFLYQTWITLVTYPIGNVYTLCIIGHKACLDYCCGIGRISSTRDQLDSQRFFKNCRYTCIGKEVISWCIPKPFEWYVEDHCNLFQSVFKVIDCCT